MKTLIILITAILLLTGCDGTIEQRKATAGTENVKIIPGDYIEYTIERGTVKCRENTRRAELACWQIKL